MSGERTETPSLRRLREARRRGEVAVSTELTGAAALAGGLLALSAVGPVLAGAAARLLRAALETAPLAPAAPAMALRSAAGAVAGGVALLAGGALGGALAAGLLQTGFLFAPAALAPRVERLDPVRGAQRLLSPSQLAAVGLGLAKAAVLVWVGTAWLRGAAPSLAGLLRLEPAALWRVLPLLAGLAIRLALALLLLGALDLLRVRRRHLRALRLTRDEARREQREDEGDPELRGERRRLHRGLLEAGQVARATVVVVNPTRLAVALQHAREGADAPRVVAKGVGRSAARIRSAARRAGVPVVRDVPLAQALHRLAEVGDEIPEELYDAAAVVLAHLYARERRP